MTAAIQVLEMRRVEDHGPCGHSPRSASARSWSMACVVLHGCRVIQQPNQKAWVALPQVPARKKADGGGAGWFPAVEITNPRILADLRAAVLEHWASLESFRQHPGDQL